MKEILAGTLLALITIAIAVSLNKNMAFAGLAILLVIIAAVYIGFGLTDRKKNNLTIEIIGFALFTVWAWVGWQFSVAVLAAGYAAHGIWDILHHPKFLQTKVFAWYPPFCLVYDLVIAGFILFWFNR